MSSPADFTIFIYTGHGFFATNTGKIVFNISEEDAVAAQTIIDHIQSPKKLIISDACQSYMEGCLFGYSLISDMGTTGGGTSFLKRESFPAVAGQTVFTPTKFHLTADALVIINNSIQSPDIYTIAGNTLTFNAECNADDIVTILN